MRPDRRSSGFTLIELLIVVAIIGIIAAIAIPNLLNAINRGKQKRTMADIRSLGLAMETYSVDTGNYPAAGATGDAVVDLIAAYQSSAALSPALVPTYVSNPIVRDGWGNPIYYDVEPLKQSYATGSTGKDTTWDGDPYPFAQPATKNFNSDIIFSDGQFLKYPDGVQQ